MKKTARLFFIMIFCVCFIKADLGIPTIQAVCKVILKNGKEIEGIISLGRGGYGNKYKSHGFCFEHENGDYQLHLYSLSFPTFIPGNFAAYKAGSTKLFYAQNITVQQRSEESFEVNEKSRILEKKRVDIENFKLGSEKLLYTELPTSLYVGINGDGEGKIIRINVDEIISLELLYEPSGYWLEEIRKKRAALIIQMKEDEKQGKEWVDYVEPVWYHEIKKNKELFDYLDRFFREYSHHSV